MKLRILCLGLLVSSLVAIAPETKEALIANLNGLEGVILNIQDMSADASADEYADALFEEANRFGNKGKQQIAHAILKMRKEISADRRKRANDLSDQASEALLH